MISFLSHRSVLIGLVTSVFVSSCGALGLKKKDDSDGPVQNPMLVASKDVMLLGVEDPACMSDGESVSLSNAQVWLWNGTETVAKSVSFPAYQSIYEGGLESKDVLAGIYDDKSERTCDYADGQLSCEESKSISEGQMIRICRSDATYGRESIESMTLTTQYMLDSARSFYEGLASYKYGMLKTVLDIQIQQLSHITAVIDGKTKHADLMTTDNAAFGPVKDKKNRFEGVFVVYPTSKESYGKSPLHLWEVPFVMRHEYGHKIFHHHLENAVSTVGLTTTDFDFSLSSIMRNAPTGKARILGLADSDTSQAQQDLSGLNEMFADLFAFYAGGAATGQLKGVESLDLTRDPASSSTSGGALKVWTSKEASIYSGSSSPAKVADGEPDFTDSHDVAAVFGYNVATLLNAAMPEKSGADRENILIKSLSPLGTYISSNGRSSTLDGMTAEMVKVIVANKTGDITKACADFAQNMSGLPLSVAQCK